MRTWCFAKEFFNPARKKAFKRTIQLSQDDARALFTNAVGKAIEDGYVITDCSRDSSWETTDEAFYVCLHKEDVPALLIWVNTVCNQTVTEL